MLRTLYHGSNIAFEQPSLKFAHDKRDFGIGFYTTTFREQAVEWALTLKERYSKESAYLYTFVLDDKGLDVFEFSSLSIEWLDMIKENRLYGGIQHGFDVVIGPVANDNTVRTIALYVEGTYDAEEAMRRLRYFKANNQVSLHTEKAMNGLLLLTREQID
jgi:hypothetical protein